MKHTNEDISVTGKRQTGDHPQHRQPELAQHGLDNLAALAAQTAGVSMAFVSFYDGTTERIKASAGFTVEPPVLQKSPASYVVSQASPLIIPDTLASSHPIAQECEAYTADIRFLAIVPIVRANKGIVGGLGVLDTAPHDLDNAGIKTLEMIAEQVSELLEMNKRINTLHAASVRGAADDQLFKEREALLGLLDQLPDLLYVKDTQNRYVVDNGAHRDLLGVDELDEVIGKTAYDFFSADKAERYESIDTSVMRNNKALLNQEERMRDSHGKALELSLSRVPLSDKRGNIEGLACIGRDVRYLKEAEMRLEQERELLNSLMDNIPDHIYFKDLCCRFIRVNNALAGWFNLDSPDGAIGKSDFDFFSREHAEQAFTDEQEIMRTGTPVVAKQEKETWPDGSVTWVSTTKEPWRDREGRIAGCFGISRDITELKQATDELAEHDRRHHEEMALAKKIHNSLVPVKAPVSEGLTFGLRFVPSSDLGGDFIDFVGDGDTRHVGVIFADITGHGIGAALLSAMLKVIVDEVTERELPVGESFRQLNEKLYREFPAGIFASGIYALFDKSNKTMTYVNASQEPILLARPGEGLRTLSGTMGALGLFDPNQFNEVPFQQHTVQLEPSDTVLFYTDGLVDFFNDAEATVQQRNRLQQWLTEDDMPTDPQNLVEMLYRRSLQTAGLSEPPDDVAALAVRIGQDGIDSG